MSAGNAPKKRPVVAPFRNRRGEQVDAASFTMTDTRKEFGRLLEMVIRGGVVVITRHDAPKAVVLSVDEFNALVNAGDSRLDALSRESDALLDRMQTPKAGAGMKTAFGASPKRLGRAAIAAARKRR